MEKATFGSGCFWCTEAIFQRLKGVISAKSGYAGGTTENPSYEEVCTGKTNHAEVIQVEYDPAVISYDELLEVFWHTHDPTTLNRQGSDAGTQYRSAVFYHTNDQRKLAEGYRNTLEDSKIWADPIVTEISPLTTYYPAESDHSNYFNRNESQAYCSFVVAPKVKKIKEVFANKLKDHS